MAESAEPRTVTIPYAPRPLQWQLHQRIHGKRTSVLVTHRRFGKTVLAVNELIRASIECPLPSPRHAYMAPTYRQAKEIAWDYLQRYAGAIPGVEFNQAELRCDLPGDRRIRLLGAENYDSLRGIYLDGIVLDEYAYMSPVAYQRVIRPTLVDRAGWALFIGTPWGRNHFFDTFHAAEHEADSYATIYRASQTAIIPEDELLRLRRDMPEEEYDQEFECSWEGAVRGAYYAKELREARESGRVLGVSYQPRFRVDTAWDLGIDDATAIVFYQRAGREVHLIDYLEASDQGLEFYARELQRRPYTYGEHWLPHDANARELGTGRSRVDTLKQLGLKNCRVLPEMGIEAGIEQARMMFPSCYFDEMKTARLLDCLSAYRKDWDEKRQVYKPHPRHDWASHGADAFRYLACVRGRATLDEEEHVLQRRRRMYAAPVLAKTSYDVYDYGREPHPW